MLAVVVVAVAAAPVLACGGCGSGGAYYVGGYGGSGGYAYGGYPFGAGYPGYSPSLTYSSAYYAPTTTATSPGYQSRQTANTAEANAAPPGFQATGKFYQPPNNDRRHPVYREIATGREVYFPGQR